MNILDTYFDLQENMRRISKTNCSEEEIKLYFESGEKILSMLDKVVNQFLKEWGETPPTMYCRDELPDMYMRYGKWNKARQTIDKCFEVNILSIDESNKQHEWINNCEISVTELINHLMDYPGALQRNMYQRLHYVDRESLKWALRAYKKIEKLKFSNTNKLFLPEQSHLMLREKDNLQKKDSINKNDLPKINKEITYPNWYVSISFGESTSKNYPQAVAIAKLAPNYIENIIDGKTLHQAVFSESPEEYLQFIKLYELVSNWKSCYVVVNGIMTDRKIVSNLNYCYGDKCRSGKSDFCYGASEYTSNPFGCHRAQMHSYNDPWYSYGIMDTKRIFHIDKDEIKKELDSRLTLYKQCPALDMNIIFNNVDNLPNTINPAIDKDWEYTTFIKNGIPQDGVQLTSEANGLVYTINLNLNDINNESNNSSSAGYIAAHKDDLQINENNHKIKSSKKNKIFRVSISIIILTFMANFTIVHIDNPALGFPVLFLIIFISFKLGSYITGKLFK